MYCFLEIWNLGRIKTNPLAIFRIHNFARAQPTAFISLRETKNMGPSGMATSTRKVMGTWTVSLEFTRVFVLSCMQNFLNSCLFPCASVRIRKVWQKRKCSVKNGFLTISHGTVSILC